MSETSRPVVSLADAGDVAATLMRPLTKAETEYVGTLLERAHARIQARTPQALERAGWDEAVRVVVVEVEAEAVARVLRADGAIYTSETEGEYTYRLNQAVASAALYVTDAEWARLGGALASISPATDGYLATRSGGVPPDRQLQYSWPAGVYPSQVL